MKNRISRAVVAVAALSLFSAIDGHAALIAYEGFDYAGGSNLTTETTNGGTGWTDAWAGTGLGGVSGLITSGTGQCLWFGESPTLISDGSNHIFSETNRGNRRNLATPVNLGTSTLYFTTLIHVYAGADVVAMRAEFFDGLDASGNMRANVGISGGDLYASTATSGYKPAASDIATNLVFDVSLLLRAVAECAVDLSA